MTVARELAVTLDMVILDWEQNRMYPPRYGKERAMKRMTSAHAAAIATSRLFLHKALDRQPEPRFRQEIEHNIQLLGEVRSYVLHGLYTPNLPWPGEEPQGSSDLKDNQPAKDTPAKES